MKKSLVALLTISWLATACTSSATSDAVPPPQNGPLEIVTTAYPLFDVASTLGGDRAEVHNLLPLDALGNEPLDPEDSERLRTADLVLSLGEGTQPAVEEATSERIGPMVEVLDSVPTHDLAPGSLDPHVWLDPSRMGLVVNAVQGALAAADPAGAPLYEKRARSYRRMVAAIDRNYSKALADCRKNVVYVRGVPVRHLVERHGLEFRPVDSAGQVPAGETLFEQQLPPLDVARETLARTGVRIAVLDPIVNRTDQARRGGANYGTVMALNLEALRSALDCSEEAG